VFVPVWLVPFFKFFTCIAVTLSLALTCNVTAIMMSLFSRVQFIFYLLGQVSRAVCLRKPQRQPLPSISASLWLLIAMLPDDGHRRLLFLGKYPEFLVFLWIDSSMPVL
jgi:hypothetical protein